MDQFQKPRPQVAKTRHERRNPSFSSSILDAIYRSIDEGGVEQEEEEVVLYSETLKKKQTTLKDEDVEMGSFSRDCLVEKWMEKKVSEKVVVTRKPVPDFDRRSENGSSIVFNSSSSSSDSCCGGGFSSSEAESVYGSRSRSREKPVRSNASVESQHYQRQQESTKASISSSHHHGNGSVNGDGLIKTKSRALKIYGDLKKVKQPISPGGRLASFINSLFTAGNPKKPKISTSSVNNGGGADSSTLNDRRSSKSTQASTCSSVSSFSRSCLSKTPTSSTRSKRSVRFYPISVIVDEDCRPCGHKSLCEDGEPGLMAVTKVRKLGGDNKSTSMISEELKFHIMEKSRRVEEAARDLLRGYERKKSNSNIRSDVNVHYEDEDDEDEDDEDDLFELDNLGSVDRYREELPVYGTTHLRTNRAIANGLIV